IIHRDISPQNILVGVDGISRISDFGIAKAESRATATRDGQLKGKVGYMAPEQLSGAEIDRRVDLFAMGVTLWESLAGRRLFYRDTELESMAAVAHSVIPSLADAPCLLPPALDAMVQKALARDPACRYATAREFGDALEGAAKLVGGLATTRQVADLVADVAGEKIKRERARMREAAAFTSATPISVPLERPYPGEASVPSGVQIGRAASPSMRPGPTRARTARWMFAAAAATVIASSVLTAVVVLRLRTPADVATAQGARPPITPPTLPAVVVPLLAVEPAPSSVTASFVATDAGSPLGAAMGDGGEVPAGPSRRGRIRSHGRARRDDDSDFIGINPYMR
ncbi:MAG: serine/threonine-protein kinase, partial [Deltaproteobacteria bacterium]